MSTRLINDTSIVKSPPPLRILVADDDPASRRFLHDALRGLGADVQTCGDGLAALGRAREACFDLLLLDCRMPGAGALAILEALRADGLAGSSASAAIATTAEFSTQEGRALLAAGFSSILLKPCTVNELRSLLGLVDDDRKPVLDDASALSTSGDVATMQALRQLLRDELSQLQVELDALRQDPGVLTDRLHRLRSSCGFCGAMALAAHAGTLQSQATEHSITSDALSAFRLSVQTTLRALQH